MAQQILYLLAKIGIFANIDKRYESEKATCPIFKIIINSAVYKKVFIEKIKLCGEKGEKLKQLSTDQAPSKYIGKIGVETTRKIAEIYGNIPKRKYRVQTFGNRRMTVEHLKKVLEDAKRLGSSLLDEFAWLTSDSIVWCPVTTISELGSLEIFDRSVPNTNNFVVNGIIVHNSGQIEQDADMVLFCYRPEYYDLHDPYVIGKEEYDTERLFVLLIEKHRNGNVGDIALKFTKHLAKISDHPNHKKEETKDLPVVAGSNQLPVNTEFENQGDVTGLNIPSLEPEEPDLPF